MADFQKYYSNLHIISKYFLTFLFFLSSEEWAEVLGKTEKKEGKLGQDGWILARFFYILIDRDYVKVNENAKKNGDNI